MNASAESANVAQATPRASRGRGRGRGGGFAPRAQSTTGKAAAKPQVSKIGPNRLLETEWVKDSILKGNCFVLFAGSGQTGDQQWTFHRPIGETSLEQSEWVATPTRDISFLLQRRESEALAAWKRQAELAKRQTVLASQMGRARGPEGQTEIWTFENAPAIQPTIRTCTSAAKAAGAPESAWLDYADQAVQVAERSFKEALRTQGIPEAWAKDNPRPRYETMGGPLGDVPQKAVPYLKGFSLASAKDKVVRVAIGLDQLDEPHSPDQSEDESSEEEDNLPPPKQRSTGNGGSVHASPPKAASDAGTSKST